MQGGSKEIFWGYLIFLRLFDFKVWLFSALTLSNPSNLTNIKDADRYTPDIWASMGFEPRITGRNLSTEMLD